MGLFQKSGPRDGRTAAPPRPATVWEGCDNAPGGSRAAPKRLLSYRAAYLQGIGARQQQEDAFALVNYGDVIRIKEKGLLAVVADGMGGMKDGRFAAETTVSGLRSHFDSFDLAQDIPSQMCDAIRDTSRSIYGRLGGQGGSTAVMCLFYGSGLYYASVGDSYLFWQHRGELYRINRQHTVYDDACAGAVRRGVIDPFTPLEDPLMQAVSKFMGLEEIGDVDRFIEPLKLEGGDVILLCSDGVGSVLSEREISECLAMTTPENMCEGLERLVLSKQLRYQDNYTALAIKCEY